MTNHDDDIERPTPVDPIPAFDEGAGGTAGEYATGTGPDGAAQDDPFHIDPFAPGNEDSSSSGLDGDAADDPFHIDPFAPGSDDSGSAGPDGAARGAETGADGGHSGTSHPLYIDPFENDDGDTRAIEGSSESSDPSGGHDTHHVVLTFECDGSDVAWTVERASCSEGLNAPYSLIMTLATDDLDAEPAGLLGTSCCLTVERGSLVRRLTGVIAEVHEDHTEGRHIVTEVSVVPALKLMQQRCDTRIFQQMSVPQILQAVLEEGLSPYNRTVELRLDREYPMCEFRTQYDELDHRFCQRLMEEEGIISWFEFEDETETLVLADRPEHHTEIESVHGASVEFSEYEGGDRGHERVRTFLVSSQLRPTRVKTRHHDWTHPSAPLEGDSGEPEQDEGEPPHGERTGPERQHYEHDLEPLTFSGWNDAWTDSDVADQVRLRREQQVCGARVIRGTSSVLGMTAGKVFELTNHPRPEVNGRYLVLSVSHDFRAGTNSFTCIPAEVPYRPQRVTAKPRIASVQTATVVGPTGEEIHTDGHGRVMVQFHWDRAGERDEHSSCWIRVMQPWAGTGWGFVFLPRIGMEVVVTFVNGDPDQPLVVGSVYNGEHRTPDLLPDEKTRSTIKTRSTPDSEGYNELTFEDRAGEEQIIVHAQKDYDETVENAHSTTVHGSQTNTVDGDQSESVGGDQSLSITGNRAKSVEGEETITVAQKREATVDGLEKDTFNASREVRITGTDLHEVSGRLTETINGGRRTTIAQGDEKTVSSGNSLTTVSAGQVLVTSAAQIKLTQGETSFLRLDGLARLGTDGVVTVTNGQTTVEGDTAGKLTLTAASEISLVCGGASLTLKADGTIEVTGTTVTTSGSGGSVEAGGAGVTVTGGQVSVSGGVVDVSGAAVRIN